MRALLGYAHACACQEFLKHAQYQHHQQKFKLYLVPYLIIKIDVKNGICTTCIRLLDMNYYEGSCKNKGDGEIVEDAFEVRNSLAFFIFLEHTRDLNWVKEAFSERRNFHIK